MKTGQSPRTSHKQLSQDSVNFMGLKQLLPGRPTIRSTEARPINHLTNIFTCSPHNRHYFRHWGFNNEPYG